jgi:lysophospholipase L1-like esterase
VALTPRLARLALAACLALLAVLAPSRAGAQTRILPLGDSITQGGQGFASYRYALWFQLEQAGRDVDFVGQRTALFGGGTPDASAYPAYLTTFDRDHEGYWGWRTDEIDGITAAIASAAQPDIVLVHLGTNDIGQLGAAGVANADTHLRSIVAKLRAAVPRVTILLARVIPIGPGTTYFANAAQVAPLNTAISAIAADLDTPASRIFAVDQNTGFDVATMVQPDGLHPNLAGEAHMAGVWFARLSTLLPPGPQPVPLFPWCMLGHACARTGRGLESPQ